MKNCSGLRNEGTNFVFGKMNDEGLAFFFLKVLCPIVFISALIGILQHIRVLPFIIRAIGTVLSKVNGMGKLESFNAVSSLILGQSENFIAYKDILGKMSRNRMYTMAATAMSTVSMSIVGAYMTMLDAEVRGGGAGTEHVQHLYRSVADQPVPALTPIKRRRAAARQTCTKARASSKCWVNTFWPASKWRLSLPRC